MKSKLIKGILAAGLALVSLVAGQAVYAQAQSATISVSANIPKTCRFWSSPAAMVIQHGGGNIDPTQTSDATGTSAINYRCQTGVLPLFDIGNPTTLSGTPLNPKSVTVPLAPSGAGPSLNAQITVDATGAAGGAGQGFGTDRTAAIDGTITYTDFSAAAIDSYSAAVTIAITAAP